MQLNREKIQRMFTGSQAYGGGGGGGDTEGLASQLWVDQNYLSKEFFLRLFNIHGEDENDDPVDVQPNDLETTITDIEAMFGFWTEQYLSALGQNSEQGGGGITLNAALASINNAPLGNPTGNSTVLMFNGTTWVYATMGSTDMNTVWNALADGTDTHQINVSHLTTALGSYFTQGSGISITNTVGGTGKTISLAQVQDLTAGTYRSVTVDTYGRVTAGTNPTTLAGYGITDALASNTTFWGRTIANGAVKGGIDQASYIEFADIASGTTNGGYIDFHYGGNTTANSGDYTSRIIEDAFDATNSQGTLKINNILWAKLSTGVSIGTSAIISDYKLNVAGYTKTTRLYLRDSVNNDGGVYLEYDTANGGVHLVNAGFYADSYVSALGVNSGGGGGTDYIPLTGSDQIAGSLIPATTNAYDLGDSTHAWRNIRGNSIYASNSLTTYYLTVNSTATVGSLTASLGDITVSAGHGFKVTGKDDTYVLLAGGGTALLSSIGGGTVSSISLTSGGTSLTPTNGVITFPAATASEYGIVKVNSVYGQAVTLASSGQGSTRNYGLQMDSTGKAFVYVPWEDNDTKNTAGGDNYTIGRLYLVGMPSQTADNGSIRTYTNANCYEQGGYLYSGGSKVLTEAVTGFLPLSGGAMTGNISYKGTNSTYQIIKFIDNTFDTYGNGIAIGGGGLTIIGGGESSSVIAEQYTNGGTKAMLIGNDASVSIFSNLSDGWSYRKSITLDTYGNLNFDGGYRIKFAAQSTSYGDLIFGHLDENSKDPGIFYNSASNQWFRIQSQADIAICADSTGTSGYATNISLYISKTNQNVGIKTTSPVSPLTVNGTIRATSFVRDDGSTGFLKANGTVDTNTYLSSTLTATESRLGMVKVNKSYGSFANLESSGNITGRNYGLQIDSNGVAFVYVPWENSTSYLPLSGGTMTGNITWSADSHGIYLFGGCGIEKWSGYSPCLVPESGKNFYIRNKNDRSDYSLILHTGNYSSYALPLSAGSSYPLTGNLFISSSYIKRNAIDNPHGDLIIGRLSNSDDGIFYNSSNDCWLRFQSQSSIVFYAGATGATGYAGDSEMCLFLSKINQRVGIKTSSPQYNLHVAGTFHASGDSSISATLTMAGNVIPSTDTQYSLGTSSKRFSAVYAGSFVKTGGTSSQFLKADGSVDSNTYLTSGDVVTTNTVQSITGAKTFTATLTSSAGGSFTGGLRFYSLCVECASDGTPSSSRSGEINRYNNSDLHLQYDTNTGGVTMCQNSLRVSFYQGIITFDTGVNTPYITTAWQQGSDMRRKDIENYIDNVDVNAIAMAPIFDFRWKENRRKLWVGTSAQYWRNVLPNAVCQNPDGFLCMDYSATALAAAVITARKVVDHEARIRLLEVENAALRNEINQLKKVA